MALSRQQAAGIQAAGIVANIDDLGSDRESLSARLQSILEEAGVEPEVQDRIAATGHTTLSLFASMGTDAKEVKEYLADVLDLDPKEVVDKSERANMRMTITRLCSAHLVSRTANEVEVRANAERSVANLPLQVSSSEYTAVRLAFERAEYKLYDEILPSKAFFERKLSELDNEYLAEALTSVTTQRQEDDAQRQIPQVDAQTGFFRMTTKTLGIEMPRDAEEYRRRWETLGICMWFVKARSPTRRVLQSMTMQRHDSILKWLFGPEVWGMATRDSTGQPLSTPNIHHVFTYELALRKAVAKAMNEGTPWWDAWRATMEDVRLLQVSFLSLVAIRPANSVTAPGMRGPAPPAGARKNLAIANPPQTDAEMAAAYRANQDRKRKLKNDKREAKRAAAPARLAILDQGQGQGKGAGKGAGKGQGKGQGKGAGKDGKGAKPSPFPDNALRETEDQTPLCIKFNKSICTIADC